MFGRVGRCDAEGDKEVSHMTSAGHPHKFGSHGQRRLAVLPTTRLGMWAVGLAAASIVLQSAWMLLGPLGGFPGLLAGLIGGIVALVAILRRSERAISVFVALVPFLGVIVFVLAELIGHD